MVNLPLIKIMEWKRFYDFVLGSDIGLTKGQLLRVLKLIEVNRVTSKKDLLSVVSLVAKELAMTGDKKDLRESIVYYKAWKIIKKKLPEFL